MHNHTIQLYPGPPWEPLRRTSLRTPPPGKLLPVFRNARSRADPFKHLQQWVSHHDLNSELISITDIFLLPLRSAFLLRNFRSGIYNQWNFMGPAEKVQPNSAFHSFLLPGFSWAGTLLIIFILFPFYLSSPVGSYHGVQIRKIFTPSLLDSHLCGLSARQL